MNYNKLTPGMYIQRGDSLKAITTSMLPNGEFRLGGSNPSPETLAASVSWVFIALEQRRAGMDEIADVTRWVRGETEAADQDILGFDIYDELPRIDAGLQLHKQVYYHKTPLRGRGFMLEWLDPSSIKPDTSSYNATNRRYENYHRTVKEGTRSKVKNVSADNLLIIQRKGMRELDGATTAGQATRLAGQVLHSMDTVLDDFYDHNALPIALVTVPPGTAPDERERLKTFFERTFSRFRTSSNKTMGVSADVTVTTLSLAPEQLELTSTRADMADAILLAHGVPVSVRQTVNKAEAGTKSLDFTRTLVSRANMIARMINRDPDVAKSGYAIQVNANRLEAMQMGELLKAEALQRLTGVPVMTVNEARERLDLEPMLGHDEIALPSQGFGQLPQPAGAVPDAEPSKAWRDDMKALRSFVKNGKHNDRWFKSNELSDAEIMAVITELDPTYGADVKMIAEYVP